MYNGTYPESTMCLLVVTNDSEYLPQADLQTRSCMHKLNPVPWKDFNKRATDVSDMYRQSPNGIDDLTNWVNGNCCL
jgi:hypothetical protein